MRRRLAILVLGGLLAAASPALADKAEAAKAFDEGRKLRDQRDFEKAANAFERSIAADPSIGAYYNLAFSYEQLGRTRDALDAYRTARRMAKDKGDPREKEAIEAVTKLLETHNYVIVIVPDDVERTANVRVTVDGEVAPPKGLAGEVFRSGSQHEVVVSAPGRRDRRIKVANRERVTLGLGDAYETTAAAPPPPPPSPPPAEAAEASSGGWGWQKWTGVGVGAAGLVTIGIGAVLTVNHASDQASLEDTQPPECRDKPDLPPLCSPARRNESHTIDAKLEANNNDALLLLPVVYGIGAALLVGGIVLFVTAPSEPSASTSPPNTLRMRLVPQVGLRDTGLSVVGTF